MKESVVMIQANSSTSFLQGMLGEKYGLISTDSANDALKICREKNNNVASIVLGSHIKDPIQTSQRIHGLDKSLSVIILTRAENVEPMRRSISFTPLLGNLTTCLSENNMQELVKEISRAVDGTIKLRQSKIISDKLNSQLKSASIDRHKVLTSSKEYLERLFDSAPIGIMTVTVEGQLLALNQAASDMFQISEHKIIGASINEIFFELNLIPDRVETISKSISGVDKHFEVTITTVQGQDQSPGYLLLVLDLTDRKKYEEALKKAVKARDEFLMVASHELRTPITSLQLQLQMTRRYIDPSELRMVRFTDNAIGQVQRLTVLVEDLLDVSKIQEGKLNFNYSQINICDLINVIVERLSHQASTVSCDIIVDIPESLVITTDPFRLDQVITNLMINAFKYAAGKPIVLKVSEQDDSIKIALRDSGMGIDPSKLSLIFNRFERGVSAYNVSGLGLGLYITKSIVDAHGGTISVENNLGEGTTFTVSLPRQQS